MNMKCQICQQNDATIHLNQVQEGVVQELHCCADCAKENGLDMESPMSLTDFLFGAEAQLGPVLPDADAECPSCGLKLSAVRKQSMMGCALCYETFGEELKSSIASMHRSLQHTGKQPVRQRKTAEIGGLQRAMHKAVSIQDFEEAAKLRDRIEDLAGEGQG